LTTRSNSSRFVALRLPTSTHFQQAHCWRFSGPSGIAVEGGESFRGDRAWGSYGLYLRLFKHQCCNAGLSSSRLKGRDVAFNMGTGPPNLEPYVIVALASALIALILAGEGWLLRACRLPFLRPIGRISCGAYVYHLPLLYFYKTLAPTLFSRIPLISSIIEFGFVYAVTLFTAHLPFRYFEQPVLKLRARFS
jgi:hypothetical protein